MANSLIELYRLIDEFNIHFTALNSKARPSMSKFEQVTLWSNLLNAKH